MSNLSIRLTILFIASELRSDDPVINVLKRTYLIETATDKESAFAILRKNKKISCAIIDAANSAFDCFSLVRELKLLGVKSGMSVLALVKGGDTAAEKAALLHGADEILYRPMSDEALTMRMTNVLEHSAAAKKRMAQTKIVLDELTGVYNKQTFFYAMKRAFAEHPDDRFMIVRFDLDRFKVFNDTFGVAAGDKLLSAVGRALINADKPDSIYAHLEADHFAFFSRVNDFSVTEFSKRCQKWFNAYPLPFEFCLKFGVYEIDDTSLAPEIMCDRALLALKSVKQNSQKRIGYYDEKLRQKLIDEQTLLSDMKEAFDERQFEVYYQPQYNYATGELVGAESLVRWNHPTRGLVMPGAFIPVMEQNGLISQLDEYVWEQCCRDIKKWLSDNSDFAKLAISVSTNVSRVDAFRDDLCDVLDRLTKSYDVPKTLLKIEITESAYMDNPIKLIECVEEIKRRGYTVEMDDFGSGYSSLNTLKDVPVDVLKLDMKFLSASSSESRSGNILSSIIRMARWLKLPVIAEGVETREQADYLKSVGCSLMQGYYFAHPMRVPQFEKLIKMNKIGSASGYLRVDTSRAEQFWNASAQTALIFNSLVGGAAIVEQSGGSLEVLRVNDRFLELVGMTLNAFQPYMLRFSEFLTSTEEREGFAEMLRRAAEADVEGEFRTHKTKAGEDKYFVFRARYLSGSSDGNVEHELFFVSLNDVSAAHRMQAKIEEQKTSLQTLYNTVSCGVLQIAVINGEATLTSFNDPAWKICCCESAEDFKARFISGERLNIEREDYERIKDGLLSVIRSETDYVDLEYKIKPKSGRVRRARIEIKRTNDVLGGFMIDCLITDTTNIHDNEVFTYGKALSAVFDEVNLLDFSDDTLTVIGKHNKKLVRGTVVADMASKLCENIKARVAKDDVPRVLDFLNYENIKTALFTAAETSITFRYEKGDCDTVGEIMLIRFGAAQFLFCKRNLSGDDKAKAISRENRILREENALRIGENERNRLFVTSLGAIVAEYNVSQDELEYTACDAFGKPYMMTVDKALNENIVVFVHRSSVDAVRGALLAAIAGQKKGAVDFRGTLDGKRYFWSRLDYTGIKGENGGVERIICVVRNIQKEYDQAKIVENAALDSTKMTYRIGETFAEQLLDLLLASDTAEGAIASILKIAGQSLDISRAYVCDCTTEEIRFRSEWTAKGVIPHSENDEEKDVTPSQIQAFMRKLASSDLYCCADESEEQDPDIAEFLAENGIKAIAIYALKKDSEIVGFVGFEECRAPREWMDERLETLSLIAKYVSVVLTQMRADEYADSASERLLAALERCSAQAYIVDKNFNVLYSNALVQESHGLVPNQPCYKQYANKSKPCEVCPVREYIKKSQATPVETVDISGRTCIMQSAPILWRGKEEYLVFGIYVSKDSIDESARQEREYRASLERYANTLCAVYDEVVELDFSKNLFAVMHSAFSGGAVTFEHQPLDRAIDSYAKNAVLESDRARLKEFLNLDYLSCEFAQGHIPTVEFSVNFKGSKHWCQSTVLKLQQEQFILCSRDITEQKRTGELATENMVLQARAEAQERYRIIVEQTGAAVVEWNHRTREFTFSKFYDKYEASKFAPSDVIDGSAADKIVCREDRAELYAYFRQVSEHKTPAPVTLRLKMTDGGFHWTRIVSNLVLDEKGKPFKTILSFTDVDAEKRAQIALEETSQRMSDIVDSVPTGIAILDVDFAAEDIGTIFLSDRIGDIFGMSETARMKLTKSRIPISKFRPANMTKEEFERFKNGEAVEYTVHFKKNSGEWIWINVFATYIVRRGKQPLCYAAIADVTRRTEESQRANWQLERYRLLSEVANVSTFDYSPDDDVMTYTVVSSNGDKIEQRIEKYLQDFDNKSHVYPDSKKSYLMTMKSSLEKAKTGMFEYVMNYGGGYRWYRAHYVSISDSDGKVYRVVGRVDDIDNEMREQKDLLMRAQTDSVTGLINKDTARMLIDGYLKQKRKDSTDFIMLLDIDNFKGINDTLGHGTGDRVLHEFSDKIGSLFRKGDLVARFGGDEFIVYLHSVGDVSVAEERAKDILRAAHSVVLEHIGELHCSIGIAALSGERLEFEDAFNQADYALYVSKYGGKNKYTVYDGSSMQNKVSELGSWRDNS